VPLARLAADHGFADQAHLAREFRALAGVAPSAFPFVQDEEAAAA
jgi:AraC-like DNA-binding protein